MPLVASPWHLRSSTEAKLTHVFLVSHGGDMICVCVLCKVRKRSARVFQTRFSMYHLPCLVSSTSASSSIKVEGSQSRRNLEVVGRGEGEGSTTLEVGGL